MGSQCVAERSLSGGFLRSKLRRVPPTVPSGVVSPMSDWQTRKGHWSLVKNYSPLLGCSLTPRIPQSSTFG
ncbi:hypothetical protein DP116_05845 [Brasilonema bromeliae SPC951]|uniref:Uncharacterized protein n=1 Tax=Brasilonema bromeliae SPC951 TaxID=385972 RepID=A0ABX1P4Q7_9CYAN|nr:hypothetical protein [Brasilonema bromeliae SPC951]